MLEHQKIVLKGVSADKYLFKKELIKSLAWLSEKERSILITWVHKNFNHQHSDIIKEVLYPRYNVAS